MPGTSKPEDLTWEHEAIRNQIRFLTNSLRGLAAQSRQGIAQSTQLKNQITLYRWSLYDFREAIRRHIDTDERLFQKFLGSTSVEDLIGEHEAIQNQLDKEDD